VFLPCQRLSIQFAIAPMRCVTCLTLIILSFGSCC